MNGWKKKRIDAELYRTADKRVNHDTALDEPETDFAFSERFEKRKRSVIRRFKPRKRKRYAVAAVLSIFLIAGASITASGLWEDVWTFTLDVGDKFISIFTGEPGEAEHGSNDILVKEVPSRFTLKEVQNISSLVFYQYTVENGDALTVSEEAGSPELNVDAESQYEILRIGDQDVFLSFKEEKKEYSVYFQYSADTRVSITGNLSRDEVLEMVESVLNKSFEESGNQK